MTYQQQRTTVKREVAPATRAGDRGLQADVVRQRDTTSNRPSGATQAARVVVLGFGIAQALLLLRIVLLALDARRGNDLVTAILAVSQPLVGPFAGLFRVDTLVTAGGSVLDIPAIVALVAITILEVLALAIVSLPRPGEDV
jgi:hypothetical protein